MKKIKVEKSTTEPVKNEQTENKETPKDIIINSEQSETTIKETQQEKQEIKEDNKIILRNKIENLKISDSVSHYITCDEEKVKEKLDKLISKNKREILDKLEIIKKDEVILMVPKKKREGNSCA